MKKTLKLLIIVIAFLCYTGNVLAYTDGQAVSIGKGDGSWSADTCYSCYKNGSYDPDTKYTESYYVAVDGGYNYVYCMDPHKDYNNSLKVKKVITSKTGDEYLNGILAIARAAVSYNPTFTDSTNVSVTESYEGVQDAYRLLRMAAKEYKKIDTCTGVSVHRLKYYGILASQIMEANQTTAQKALGLSSEYDKASEFYSYIFKDSGCSVKYKDDKSIVMQESKGYNIAKSLFIEGLKGMAGNSTHLNDSVSAIISKSSLKAEDKNVAGIGKNLYYDIKIKDFTAANAINSITLTKGANFPASAEAKITGYSLDDGATFTDGVPSSTVLNSFVGTDTMVVRVSVTVNNYNCEDIKFTLKANYKSTDSNGSAVILEASKASGDIQDFISIDYQDYVTGDGDGSLKDKSASIDVKVNFCDEKCLYQNPENMTDDEKMACCDDWASECENDDMYCEYYGSYCAACDTEIVVPNACTDEGEVSVNSGSIKSAVDDEGNTNIKACLLMRKKDEAGHSYEAMKNDYCAVYCKEDFTFDLPGIQKLNSGTYFQLEATISGTKSCYTSKIDTSKFLSDIAGLSTSSSAYESAVNQYNACVNMEVDYECFDPVINYKYEEIYNDQLGENNKFILSGDVVETDKQTTYCSGTINDDYSCNGGTTTPSTVSGVPYFTDYVSSTVKKNGIYITPSIFYTKIDGTITTDSNATNASKINGLPVALNQNQGRHAFYLTLGNIGQYYNETSCRNGRIIGDDNSVLKSQADNDFKGEYYCYYDVNCPDCDFDCDGPLCEIEDCGEKACEVACIGNGCAYNNEYGLSYAYRTVSLNNLNPNYPNRNLGYNWSTDTSVNKAGKKVEAAIEEIENNGEAAYENDPLYSFTLTPALIQKLKDHNNSELRNGGYANDSLVCEDYEYNGKTYENVNCKSSLLEDLASGIFGSVTVTIPNDDNRFINWMESDYCRDNACYIGNGIGPSYK